MKQQANSLNGLADYLDQLVSDLPILVSGVAREAAEAIAMDLVQNTPVDTGEAMCNWVVSLDSPVFDTEFAFDPSPRGKMRQGVWTHTVDPAVTRAANLSEAQATITAALEAKQPGQDIFITNSLPYINSLNDGSSKQTPSAFVDRAIIVGKTVAESAKIL